MTIEPLYYKWFMLQIHRLPDVYRGTIWQSDGTGGWTKRKRAWFEADSIEALEAIFEESVDAILDSLE